MDEAAKALADAGWTKLPAVKGCNMGTWHRGGILIHWDTGYWDVVANGRFVADVSRRDGESNAELWQRFLDQTIPGTDETVGELYGLA